MVASVHSHQTAINYFLRSQYAISGVQAGSASEKEISIGFWPALWEKCCEWVLYFSGLITSGCGLWNKMPLRPNFWLDDKYVVLIASQLHKQQQLEFDADLEATDICHDIAINLLGRKEGSDEALLFLSSNKEIIIRRLQSGDIRIKIGVVVKKSSIDEECQIKNIATALQEVSISFQPDKQFK